MISTFHNELKPTPNVLATQALATSIENTNEITQLRGLVMKQWVPTGEIKVNDYIREEDGFDITYALKKAISEAQPGYLLRLNPLPDPRDHKKSYELSSQVVIDKGIRIESFWVHVKNSAAGIFENYGCNIKVKSDADISIEDGAFKITSQYASIDGIALKGWGTTRKGIGFHFTESHRTEVSRISAVGFEHGIYFGLRSNHNYVFDSLITGNKFGVTFGVGNGDDFAFYTTTIEANIIGDICLPKNQSSKNILLDRCHMGFSEYPIWQDPETTTGDGFSMLTLESTPIERPGKAFMNVQNIGWVKINSYLGWWTNTPPTTPGAFLIKNVSFGPIEMNVNLVPEFPNPNCTNLVNVSGYSNSPIRFNGRLNGFAQNWLNYSDTVQMKYVWINGLQFAGQHKGIMGYNLSTVAENVLQHKPLVSGLFEVMVHIKVNAVCTPVIGIHYNNGTTVVAIPIKPMTGETGVLQPGDYHFYPYYFRAHQHNSIRIEANTDVASSCQINATISPKMNADYL